MPMKHPMNARIFYFIFLYESNETALICKFMKLTKQNKINFIKKRKKTEQND